MTFRYSAPGIFGRRDPATCHHRISFWTFRRPAGGAAHEIALAIGLARCIESARGGPRPRAIPLNGPGRGSKWWTCPGIDPRGRVRGAARRDLSRWRSGENEKIYFSPGPPRSGPAGGRTGRYQSQGLFAGTVAKHLAAE